MRRRRGPGRRPGPDASLTACRSCAADYVIPTDWAQQEDSWWIRLRCGECGEPREVVVSDTAAQRYNAELDRGVHEIARGLDRLEREQLGQQQGPARH